MHAYFNACCFPPNTAACLSAHPFDSVDLLSNSKVQRNGEVYPGFAQFILSMPLYVALDKVKNPYAPGPETTATQPFLSRCVANPGGVQTGGACLRKCPFHAPHSLRGTAIHHNVLYTPTHGRVLSRSGRRVVHQKNGLEVLEFTRTRWRLHDALYVVVKASLSSLTVRFSRFSVMKRTTFTIRILALILCNCLRIDAGIYHRSEASPYLGLGREWSAGVPCRHQLVVLDLLQGVDPQRTSYRTGHSLRRHSRASNG
jgi:hypothetical protein